MFDYAFGVFSGAEGGEEKEEGKQRGGTVSRSPSLHTPPCFKRVVVIGAGKGLKKEMALGFCGSEITEREKGTKAGILL